MIKYESLEFELSEILLNIRNLTNDRKIYLDSVLNKQQNVLLGNDNIPIFTFVFGSEIMSINKGIETSLKTGKYITDSKQEVIWNKLYNGVASLWNIDTNSFFINEPKSSFMSVRNWFFLTLLDPYSIACLKYGKIVLHGALWKVGNAGVLVLGHSGSGKSTLSYLLRDAYEILSDDVFVINYRDNKGFVAYPINTGMGFLRSVIDEEKIEYKKENVLFETPKKVYLSPEVKCSSCSVPVRKIIILCPSTENCVEHLSFAKALTSILDMQTNISHKYLYQKYILLKLLCNSCDTYKVQYKIKCNEETLDKIIRE